MRLNTNKLLVDLIGELYTMRSPNQLVALVLKRLPALIGSHNQGIALLDHRTGEIEQMNLTHPFTHPNFADAMQHGFEIMPDSVANSYQGAVKRKHKGYPIHIISRHYSLHQWENHALYRELFRHENLVDCLSLGFGKQSDRFMLCLHRDRRGFTDSETATLQRLAPHLEQAFANAKLFAFAETVDRLNTGSNFSRLHFLPSHRKYQLKPFIEDCQLHPLRQASPQQKQHFSRIEAWLKQSIRQLDKGHFDHQLEHLVIQSQHQSSTLRFARHWGSSGLLLIETYSIDCQLSTRETEVLKWLSFGKADKEIAIILGIAPHTVKEYLRRLFKKLNLHSRADAARFYLSLYPHDHHHEG